MPELSAHRLIYGGGLWFVAVVLWMWAAVWIDRDARATPGSATRWALAMALCGPPLVLAPLLVGLSASSWWLLGPLIVGGLYLWRREGNIAPEQRRDLINIIPVADASEGLAGFFKQRGTTIRVMFSDPHGKAPHDQHRADQWALTRALRVTQPIFDELFSCNASSMQLEPRPDGLMRVLYQIDGVTKQRKFLPQPHGTALTVALKALAGTRAGDALQRDSGIFTFARDTDRRNFVATTRATAFGDSLELHACDEPFAEGLHRDGLDAMGIPWRACESLRSVLQRQSGMLLIAAPAHCGRTATGYALLGEIDPLARTVATVEHRIEEHLQFATQSPTDPETGRPCATVLRAVLAQNPDVVFIDEIRDRETAEVAVEAAAHRLVIATIHADDAASSFLRLLGLGVDAHAVQETVTAALALRLARKLCNVCKKSYEAPGVFRKKLRRHGDEDLLIYKRQRCTACHHTGYSGRIPITEFLQVDDQVRDLIRSRAKPRRIRRHARRAGMQTLRESAIALVRDGVTSIREVVRVVP